MVKCVICRFWMQVVNNVPHSNGESSLSVDASLDPRISTRPPLEVITSASSSLVINTPHLDRGAGVFSMSSSRLRYRPKNRSVLCVRALITHKPLNFSRFLPHSLAIWNMLSVDNGTHTCGNIARVLTICSTFD